MKERIQHEAGNGDLSSLEQRTLRYIHRAFGHSPFLLEQFLREAPVESSQAEWHVGLIGLCRKQVVNVMRKTWGERLFQISVDRYFQQFSDYYPQLQEIAEHSWHDEFHAALEPFSNMAERVLILMMELEREPVRFTQKGRLHKKSKERLCVKLGLEPVQEAEDSGLPVMLEEALDLILRMRMARKEDDRIIVDEERYAQWLNKNAHERDAELFMIWYRVHCPPEAALQWLSAAARHLTDGQWMALSTLLDVMNHHALHKRDLDIEGWVKRLHRAGWMEVGMDADKKIWLRRYARPDEERRTLIVQPDFEIIALANTPFTVLRKLHQISETTSTEAVHRVQLTRESVQQAFEQGWDAAGMMEFLRRHAIEELPGNLTKSIAEWEAHSGQIRLVRGVLLYTESESAAFALQMNGEQLQLSRLSEHYWLISGKDEQEVKEHLNKQGLSVTESFVDDQANRVTLPDEDDAEPLQEAPSFLEEALKADAPGFYRPHDASILYRTDKTYPASEEVYPNFERIPAIWYQQYRGYHPSTAKQLIEQAIRWRTGVRMRATGQDHVFVPRTIDDRQHPCTITGYCGSREVRLNLEQIEQLKLLVPGLLE